MMIFGAITSILGLAGSWLSYSGTKAAAKAQEQAALRQQEAARLQARNIENQTAENLTRARVNARRRLARLRADYGTSGIAFGDSTESVFAETSGRLELEIQDAARAGAMDAQNIRSAGDMAAWEGRVRAAGMRQQAMGTLLSDTLQTASNLYSLR